MSLRSMKKPFKVQQARDAIRWTREARIEAMSGFIVGWPGETPEDIQNTVDFAIELGPDVAVFTSLALFPGSELFNEMEKQGRVVHHDWKHYLDTSSHVFDSQLGGETLSKEVRRAFRRYYLRPSFVKQKLGCMVRNGHPRREVRNIVMGALDMFT